MCVICCWPSTPVHYISLTETYRAQHANATGSAPVPSPHTARKGHRQSAGAQPALCRRTSDPWALKLHYKVASSQLPAPHMLCLPRNLHMQVHQVLGLPRDLHTEVHKVLRLPRNLHTKVHEALRLPRNLYIKRRRPADARAYIRPLGTSAAHSAHGGSQSAVPADLHTEVHKVLCLPRNLHMEGSQSAAPATKSAHQAPVPSRRQGIHPTPWQAASAAHSVQMLPAERRCPADARACIRPLGKQQAPHTVHMEVHKVLCLPRDLHMKVHKVLRLPRNAHIQRRCPADARAYIRPLGKQQSAVPATRSAHGGSQSTAPATKSAHEGSQSAAPATKSAHPAPVPSRRQGVHPTPWQAAKRCACHEICTRRFTKYCACHEICT